MEGGKEDMNKLAGLALFVVMVIALATVMLAPRALKVVQARAEPTCYCTNGVRFAAQGTCYFCQDVKTMSVGNEMVPWFTDERGVARELTWAQLGFAGERDWAKRTAWKGK
jgi:hypothetical protein